MAALLTPRPYTLNLDGFGATIRRRPFLRVAPGCKNGLVKRITLHAVACSFCVLRVRWCQQWCQSPGHAAEGIPKHASNILWSGLRSC